MALSCNLGFPRIGVRRELKHAVERFWQGATSADELLDVAKELRRRHWQLQRNLGIAHIPCNDFSLYDHVLDTAAMVGAVPARFAARGRSVDLATYFAMARGTAEIAPLEMTKWFDTNYHYLVPEFEPDMQFQLASTKPVDEFCEALALGIRTRPVLLGPISFLLLGKSRLPAIRPLDLLDSLLPVYEQVLAACAAAGAEWVQIDEPILATDLSPGDLAVFPATYARLAAVSQRIKICLATYFGHLRDNLAEALALPVAALHLDLVRAPEQLQPALQMIRSERMLSLGVVDGRNIWRCDLRSALALIKTAVERLGSDRVLIGPSCSLLHCPIDLDQEHALGGELRSWLAFAQQKLGEIGLLSGVIGIDGVREREGWLAGPQRFSSDAVLESRRTSHRIHNPAVKQRVADIEPTMLARSRPFAVRRRIQQERFHLPPLPTTTIGSFPQTAAIRHARAALKKGQWTPPQYEAFCEEEIARVVRFQEEIGLDVLVHGECERNDMVEYFAQQLEGFAFTENGWVQSYGSRCVKPPIIFGDVSRPKPMTVRWSRYAQSLTARPMKAMLTGPITLMKWSFVRDDQPLRDTARQIALAIRDEVADLQQAGLGMIQIDEPALREGLPLHRGEWAGYLRWAVDAFRLAACGVEDDTQIHTHMCYCEFSEILPSIAELDADVLSLEASRSDMELLETFARFCYPNDVGPGVYDIHSPRVPEVDQIAARLHKALRSLRSEQLWVNPDCGLKTRDWPEVTAALKNLVAAAKQWRRSIGWAQ